ncbi:DNA binding protein [Streptomyces noursei ATCC 11455]|nr:DNA binding protein [Streptomyces noursei ATCC 11455]
MPFSGDEHTGTRIASQRKRAGFTQRGLTAKIPFSYSLLIQVETGAQAGEP